MPEKLGSIHLQNFKAFGRPTTIRLAPITLIFGSNSAGKSTVLQSLYLMKQSIESRAGLDAPALSFTGHGAICDLGNFSEAVTNGETKREISLGLGLAESDLGVRWTFRHADATRGENASDHELSSIALASEWFESTVMQLVPDAEAGLFAEDEGGPSRRRWRYELQSEAWIRERLAGMPVAPESMQRAQIGIERLLERWQSRTMSETMRGELNALRSRLPLTEDRHEAMFATIVAAMRATSDIGPMGLRLPMVGAVDAMPSPGNDANPISLLRRANRRTLSILEGAHFIGPMRTSPSRIYTVGIGGNRTRDRYFGADVPLRIHHSRKLRESVNEWLRQLGINYELVTVGMPEQGQPIAVQLRLRRTGQGASNSRAHSVAVTDVGYGISQLLPIVVNCLALERTLITVEQPEVHVHPKLQTQLGDLLVHSALAKGNQMIVETHSEHLILRLMKQVRKRNLSPSDVSVLHVGSVEGEGAVVTELPLDDRGRFLEAWPEGFFDERLEEMGD